MQVMRATEENGETPLELEVHPHRRVVSKANLINMSFKM